MSALLSHVRVAGGRFLRDETGGMAVFLAAGIIVLTASVGLGVDTIRGYLVQSRLASALDAAGLAGARVMFSPTRDADIQMYFDANFPPGFMNATVTGPTFTVDAQSEVLTLSAQATIGTSFMRVLGFETLTVAANSEITRQTELLELVLAVDMSGSMDSWVSGGGRRIDAARDAAVELVNILFGEDETKPLLKIAVVPWSGKVNVRLNGTTYDSSQTTTQAVPQFINPITGASQSLLYYANNSPVPLLSAPPSSWKGCVYQRYKHDGINNDADLALETGRINNTDWHAWQVVGPEGEPVPGGAECSLSVSGSECTPCITHGITPLQSNKSTTLAAINELTSPEGTTNAPQGLGWAWRVLMPDPPFTEAELNPPGNRTRAIILLTDGEIYGGSGDGYKAAFGLGTSAQGSTPPSTSNPKLNKRLVDIATAIKNQGTLIYTIQFAFSSGSLANLMKQVATAPDAPFYHYAPDRDTLRQVFREVANDLSQLRVSM